MTESAGSERSARALTMVYAAGTVAAVLLFTVARWSSHRATWLELAFGLVNVPVSSSPVSVVVLGLITRALVSRKRVGLLAVAGCQIWGMVLGLVALARLSLEPGLTRWPAHELFNRVLDAASLLVGGVALWWLLRIRGAFRGHMLKGSWARLAMALGIGTATTVVVTGAMLQSVERPSLSLGWRQMLALLARSLGDVDEDTRFLLIGVPGWIPQVTSVLLAATLITAALLFLRSGHLTNRWSGDREVAVRRLLRRFGSQDSLGYFATRRDKSTIFAPDGQAAISYGVVLGVSLASGDPIGDYRSWPAAIGAWKEEARHFGWMPAVVSTSEEGARAYVAAGLNVISLGDEAILDPSRFTLNTPGMNPVRRAVRRATRDGLNVRIRRQDQIDADELAQIVREADHWRRGAVDRGFSMALNRAADPADGRILWVTAHDQNGLLLGVLSFVPWGEFGLSLDLMRRSPDAPPGVTELLVTNLMAECGRLGLRVVSLNFCMFRTAYSAADQFGASSLTRLNSSVLGVLDRLWQLERLYRANQKFGPQWRPRFLCYDDRVALPQVAVAVGIVEGFLPGRRSQKSTELRLSPSELEAVLDLRVASSPEATDLPPLRKDQARERLAHLDALTHDGHPPFPIGIAAPDLLVRDAAGAFRSPPRRLRVAGRVRAIRDHGGVVFLNLVDNGHSVQAHLEVRECGADAVEQFTHLVDPGDILILDATPSHTRRGTPSLAVHSWQMAAKSLQPVPWAGLGAAETRLRNRSLDLLVHPREADRLRDRAKIIAFVRHHLEAEGYLEVETPILHTVHGGASARPFTTYINAYGVELSLRIAPELYLKRLVVGGLGPIFEIGRNFRNEGVDTTHNPEFTSLEVYIPYADFNAMRVLTEHLVKGAATAVHGRPAIPLPPAPGAAAKLVEIGEPWPVVTVLDAVSAATGTLVSLETDFDELLALGNRHEIEVHDGMGPGAVIEELYAKLVERHTVRPTFFTDFPRETSPLAGDHRHMPGLVERWDLVINRMEIATAYSELTDPVEQRRRLTEQSRKAAAGDPEAMQVDEDFLLAMETGMPPTGGLGLGMDRLVMLILHTGIRDVLSFPFVKPRTTARDQRPPA